MSKFFRLEDREFLKVSGTLEEPEKLKKWLDLQAKAFKCRFYDGAKEVYRNADSENSYRDFLASRIFNITYCDGIHVNDVQLIGSIIGVPVEEQVDDEGSSYFVLKWKGVPFYTYVGDKESNDDDEEDTDE